MLLGLIFLAVPMQTEAAKINPNSMIAFVDWINSITKVQCSSFSNCAQLYICVSCAIRLLHLAAVKILINSSNIDLK